MNKPDASVTVSTSTPTPTPPTKTPEKVEVTEIVETVDEIPFEMPAVEEKSAPTSSTNAEDILAQIRARQKA
jgi:hypothetical protein